MEYQTYAHRAVMQGNTPEPTIWNGADSDRSLGSERPGSYTGGATSKNPIPRSPAPSQSIPLPCAESHMLRLSPVHRAGRESPGMKGGVTRQCDSAGKPLSRPVSHQSPHELKKWQ